MAQTIDDLYEMILQSVGSKLEGNTRWSLIDLSL